MNQPDFAGLAYLEANEQQLLDQSEDGTPHSPTPIPIPNPVERAPTGKAPHSAPLASSSNIPSMLSNSTSLAPSTSPSYHPSEQHYAAPSLDPYPPNTPPENPERGYFNYNNSSEYGPQKWGSVRTPDPFYWAEFGAHGFGPWNGLLKGQHLTVNMCQDGQLQSPIDVQENGAVCNEIHQVREKQGDYSLSSDAVQKRIESHALRLLYPRRPCANLNDTLCQEPDPPFADFPNGWKGTGDVIHIDFKIPSEHTIGGESFDAEMQIYHIYPTRHRVAAYSAPIRAQTDGYNYYLQEAINAFQKVYGENQAHCARRLRKGRHSPTDVNETIHANATSQAVDFDTVADVIPQFDQPGDTLHDQDRDLQTTDIVWNPYHEMLIPTIYFYRYEGSITEPPCGQFVSWWVAVGPMIISFDQLEQMKRIQFTNVDSNCKRTSVEFAHSVARPIQNTNYRPVWKCTPANFGPDPSVP
jgi:carbonic anhydrase